MSATRAPAHAAAALAVVLAGAAPAAAAADAERGEYVLRAAGCVACHTDEENDGPALAGGRALPTPFGTFHSPNITPHPEHGIGGWTEAQFVDALTLGVGPGGEHYYPVFPYTSYTRMRREDAADLFAYLRSIEPVARANRPHDLPWYMRWRLVNRIWKLLFFEPGPYEDDPSRSEEWNRGAYIARALAHCGECHTPRNVFGARDESRYLAGNPDGPEDSTVPNITSHDEAGIGRWSAGELGDYFAFGLEPDGDVAGGLMATVIDETLVHLTATDVRALIEYLKSVPAKE